MGTLGKSDLGVHLVGYNYRWLYPAERLLHDIVWVVCRLFLRGPHMSQLRRKMEAQPARPRYILTEPGAGYRMAGEPS